MRRLLIFGKMLFDGRVPLRLKLGFILLAGGYLVIPLDLVPDILPLIGIVDDGGVILAGLAVFSRYARRHTEPKSEISEDSTTNQSLEDTDND